MIAVAATLAAAYGVHLLYTGLAMGWRGVGPGDRTGRRSEARRPSRSMRDWLTQAGLGDVSTTEFVSASAVIGLVGGAAGFAFFGGVVAPAVLAVSAAGVPTAAYRARRARRREQAQDAWPRLIEELRILTGSLGRSIPQALFEVGSRAPDELRGAFEEARREWLLTTDFERALGVLKAGLADPTADAACETLLIAHDVGGTDLDRRLEALVDDRLQEVAGRKDARARQAGARFARRFVLIVPVGMALVGMSIGEGRDSYGTAAGQIAVIIALGVIGACWWWAGRIMAVPSETRVFGS